MEYDLNGVSPFFAPHRYAPGAHVCQIFSTDDEREQFLLQFVLSGMKLRERTSCFSNKTSERKIEVYLDRYGISCRQVKDLRLLALAGVEDVYAGNNIFDPEEMISLLREFYQESLDLGYSAVRVIGEMMPQMQSASGISRLMQYEGRIGLLQKQFPVKAFCQYDARLLDGETMMNILRIHPLIIAQGTVLTNPFYVRPEDDLRHH